MRKAALFMLAFILYSFQLLAQQGSIAKLTLKTGATYTGTILVENDEIIMIQIKDGSKMQFQFVDVLKKELMPENTELSSETENSAPATSIVIKEDAIKGRVEIADIIGNGKNSFENKNFIQAFLIFGKTLASQPEFYIGAGGGVFTSTGKTLNISFIPVFINLEYTEKKSTKNRPSAFAGMKAGYSFSIQESINGGIFIQPDLGMKIKLNNRSTLRLSLTLGNQIFSGKLKELNNGNYYSYEGGTTLLTIGLRAGFEF